MQQKRDHWDPTLTPEMALFFFQDHQGCWKCNKRQKDTFASMTIPYVDANVAAELCKVWVITYQHIIGSGIKDDWFLQHIVPNLSNHLEQEVVLFLAMISSGGLSLTRLVVDLSMTIL